MKQIISILLIFLSTVSFSQNFEKIAVGKKAENFKLKTIQGDEVQLKEALKTGVVVLVILRGWPGYQCPICTKQVNALITEAGKFAEFGASVLMVYPGPSSELQAHAREFSEDFKFPDKFHFTLDPDYSMINKYCLRWEEEKETAYPSTFVINKKGEIVYSKISTSHGGRASNDEIIEALGKL